MAASPQPERRQLQHRVRQALLDAIGDAGHKDRVGDGGQMAAVLLARRDGGEYDRLVARHTPQLGEGHLGKFHGGTQVVIISPSLHHYSRGRQLSRRAGQ